MQPGRSFPLLRVRADPDGRLWPQPSALRPPSEAPSEHGGDPSWPGRSRRSDAGRLTRPRFRSRRWSVRRCGSGVTHASAATFMTWRA